jgi:hypothetical protein
MTTFEGNTFEGETLFGTFYPQGYIVASVDDPADADRAHAALQQAGFDEVRTWTGQEVLERHQAFIAQRNLAQRVGSIFASDEKLALDDYLEAAQPARTALPHGARSGTNAG